MNKVGKIIIVVLSVILAGAVIILKHNRSLLMPSPVDNSATDIQGVKPLPQTKDTQPSEPLPRLVDLGADKCIPCKMMAPILEELQKEYTEVFNVEFVDVWINPDAALQHDIRVIPTQIFFDASGKELFRHEGFFSKEDILAKWKQFGVELAEPQ